MTTDNQSLGDVATFAGQAKRRGPDRDVSLGDERTVGGGDSAAGVDTTLGEIEVVDLEARYKPEGTLGQGGMGAVVLATDTRLDRKVAIKRILGEAAGNRMAVQRFLTEAKSIAALNHLNVVQIYDYGRAKDGPFLIMEYVDGGSLLDKCRGTAIPLEEAIGLACQLCDGLGKAHDLGIIHRDIKPANVLLTKDGIPKLTDFGLAKAETGDHGQTMTGAVLGTPDFMPPEQRRDASLVDHRSDLWSLAATVYQMVTGRSPKIIRFDLLPPELTKVLGKALEDEKDSRYQSARELRDAIKSSVRDSAVAEPSLGEGQCPGCGTKNDSSRRFCRSCGESLEAPCLSCTKPMPMWEEICGQCGSKQRPLVEERRAGMAARQLEAESSLADFDFDRSLQIATSLKDEPDPRLRHLKGWAEQFLTEIDHKRQEQLSLAVRALSEALRHEQAFDYSSGIHSLELVPAIVRDHSLPGQQETVASALTRLSMKQAECRRLDSLIKARIAGRQLAGLLPEVEKLLVLRPDRQDVQKLKTQLEERHQKLVRQRDEAVAKAHKAMAAHDYQGAAAALDVIDRSVITSEAKSLGAEANARWSQVQELVSLIKAAVAEKRYDGLLGPVEELLQLMPQDQEAQRLRQSLLVREEKTAADVAAIESQADAAWKACQFAQAVKLIERIPESRRSGDVAAIQDACVDMGMAQSMAANSLRSLTADSDIAAYDSAIGQAQNYQATLEQWSLIDKALEESLRRVVEARAALVAEKEQRERQQRSVRLAIFSAAALAVVIVMAMTGLWLRAAVRSSRVASAIAQSRWEDALSLDPDNAQALVGRAKAKLAANPLDVAGSLSDLDRAERQPGAEKIAAPVRADIQAIEAAQHAQAGRLDRAGDLVRAAKTAGAAAALVTRADEAIALGWLAHGTEAVAKGDAKAVRMAANAAIAAGSQEASVAPLRARGLVLEAVATHSKGNTKAAADGLSSALLLDAGHVKEVLGEARHAALRADVVAAYRGRFDAAVTGKDWPEALRVAAAAKTFDTSSNMWVDEAVGALPPAALASLPPAALASLPPATLAALPPLENSLGMKLKFLPAGRFTMGQQGGDPDETLHTLTLSRPFYLGVTEVTNGQWQRVMGSVPSKWKEADRPVEQVSWEEAVAFCQKLSELPGERKAGRVYRLPTEAEWEYACRAGTDTTYSFGDDEGQLGSYGWYDKNSGSQTHAVGEKQPNAWGLYDMHGNVWEWCSDWYGEYPRAAVTDPQGPSGGSSRVFRGGGWDYAARSCRAAIRRWHDPSHRNVNLGFRLALSPSGSSPPEAGVR